MHQKLWYEKSYHCMKLSGYKIWEKAATYHRAWPITFPLVHLYFCYWNCKVGIFLFKDRFRVFPSLIFYSVSGYKTSLGGKRTGSLWPADKVTTLLNCFLKPFFKQNYIRSFKIFKNTWDSATVERATFAYILRWTARPLREKNSRKLPLFVSVKHRESTFLNIPNSTQFFC